MSYGLIYTIPFATLDNVPCVVEIEKDEYTGKVTELMPASSPFTVEIDDEEFLYTPTRFSTATIRIVGSDYLQSLFSIAYQQYRVIFKKNGIVTWCGFIKPELYTQDYSSTIFELQLECMSAMSTLEFIDYKQVGDSRAFVSFWELLKKCISSANSQYSNIYIPHVYAQNAEDYVAGTNVLESMTVSEQDFFDEDDKPMKLKEVLEEICKFLNWTCIDWRGELYFVDIDHIGEYYKYNPVTIEKVGTGSPTLLNIQNIGFAGSEHALDILPGYNKVTVKDSNYPVDALIPDLFESSFLNPLIKSSPFYRKIDGDKFSYFVKFYTNPRFDNIFSDKDSLQPIKIDIETLGDNADSTIINNVGSLISKQAKYKWEDGKPSSLSFEDILIIGMGLSNKNYSDLTDLTRFLNKDIPVLQINPDYLIETIVSPSDGISYLLLSGQYFQSDSLYTNPAQGGDGKWNNVKGDVCCKFKLKIGNKYWTGGKWSDEESRFSIDCGGRDKSKVWYEWNDFENNVTYDMNIDSTGYAIPIKPEDKLFGKIEFTVLRPISSNYGEGGRIKRYPYYTFMRNLKLQLYSGMAKQEEEKNNSDRIYENIVNENYINELDEIEFKISSYNNDGACYSKVMLGDDYLTDNLYSVIEETKIRPEELLIRRIIKRYSAPHIKLTQTIKAIPNLTPISRLYDNYMVNKRFINAGGSIDYKMNQFQCIMIEV